MNSPTHCVMALAILSKKGSPQRNWAAFTGAVVPDAFIYLAWPWLTFVLGESQQRIWNEIYFDAPMQLIASAFNSVPIYLALGASGWFLRQLVWGKLLLIFASAALIHIAFDFPFHNHDAYSHFWPLSNWRFISPLSYWETQHHAYWVAWLETCIACVCLVILWKRFDQRWVRTTLVLIGIIYAAGLILRGFLPF